MARIVGAHSIVYSKDAEADREFFRDVLGLPFVDVGHGWLIFGLPPAEVAMHPGEANDEHEFYLMVDDVAGFVHEMGARGVRCDPVQSLGWGVLTAVTLPGGGRLGVYQPRHARPPVPRGRSGRPPRGPARKRPVARRSKTGPKTRPPAPRRARR